MITELTFEEKTLLHQIVTDKYSVGAFAGMIFNAKLTTDRPTEQLIQQALRVRLTMKELTENQGDNK